MKKTISISLSLLMLAAIFHVYVAHHYCGGKEVASNLSLSGRTASCDMPDDKEMLSSTGMFIYPDCCDNVVTFYGIENDYLPSLCSAVPVNISISQVFPEPVYLSDYSFKIPNLNYFDISPPGRLISNTVDLPFICTFRI